MLRARGSLDGCGRRRTTGQLLQRYDFQAAQVLWIAVSHGLK